MKINWEGKGRSSMEGLGPPKNFAVAPPMVCGPGKLKSGPVYHNISLLLHPTAVYRHANTYTPTLNINTLGAFFKT